MRSCAADGAGHGAADAAVARAASPCFGATPAADTSPVIFLAQDVTMLGRGASAAPPGIAAAEAFGGASASGGDAGCDVARSCVMTCCCENSGMRVGLVSQLCMLDVVVRSLLHGMCCQHGGERPSLRA